MLRASASSINFSPLLGLAEDAAGSAGGSRRGSRALAGLLTIDETTILLDAGWTPSFDSGTLRELAAVLDRVDCVIISAPDLAHCGAVPFLHKRLRPGTPIFATFPTSRLGLYHVLTEFNSRFPNAHTFDDVMVPAEHGGSVPLRITVDDIYAAFRAIQIPKGGRAVVTPLHTRGAHEAVTLEPHLGGRVLGGTAWRIAFQTDDIMYLPDFTLKKSVLLKPFDVPASANVLIASAVTDVTANGTSSSGTAGSGGASAAAEQQLLARIKASVRRNADVLLPVDATGSGIDLIAMLSALFKREGLTTYKIVFAFAKASEVLQRVKTMTEQVKDHLFIEGDDVFLNVLPRRTAEEALAVDSPKVIVAHGAGCDHGITGELIEHFLAMDDGGIYFTGGAPPSNTFGAALYADTVHNKEAARPALRGGYIGTVTTRVELVGAELEDHLLEEHRLAEERARAKRTLQEARLLRRGGELDSDDDDDDDDGDTGATAATTTGAATGASGGTAAATAAHDGSCRGGTAAGTSQVPRLFLPPHMEAALRAAAAGGGGSRRDAGSGGSSSSGRLMFPLVEARATLADIGVYGAPLAEWEVAMMRRNAPMRQFNDSAPEFTGANDAQRQDNHPARIETRRIEIAAGSVRCFVGVIDLSALPAADSLRHLLKAHFLSLRSVVLFGGAVTEARLLSNFCQSAGLLRGGDARAEMGSVHVARAHQSIELAREVFAYDVRLDPALAHEVEQQLSRVAETRGSGQWELARIRAVVDIHSQGRGKRSEGEPPQRKSARTEAAVAGDSGAASGLTAHGAHDAAGEEEGGEEGAVAEHDELIVLRPVPQQQCSAAAQCRDAQGIVPGATFVGSLELPQLRDSIRRELKELADLYPGAPLLNVGMGKVYVRRADAGDVALVSLASLDQFKIRRKVYGGFAKVL